MGYSSLTLLAGTVMALYSTHLIETWLVAFVIVVVSCLVPFCSHFRRFLVHFILLLIGILSGTYFVSNLAEQQSQLPDREWVLAHLKIEQVDYHGDERSRFVAELSRVSFAGRVLVEDCQCRVQLYWYGDSKRYQLAPGQRYSAEINLKNPTTYWNQGGERPARYLWAKQLAKQGYVRAMKLNQVAPSLRWRIYDSFQHADLEFRGLLQALAIGYRGDIPQAQRVVWQRHGLQHLMAISGLHISLVAGLVFLLIRQCLSVFPHRGFLLRNRERLVLNPVAAVIALLGALIYTALAGFAISAQRAWLMLLLFWGQRWLGLTTRSWKRLWYAAIILVVSDPGSWHDIGFWFSILAVTVILLCQWSWRNKPSASWVTRIWQTFYLQLLFLTLMGPISLALFDGVSLIAPFSNLFVVPIIAIWVLPLTLLGAIAAMCWSDSFAANLWWLAEQPLIAIQPLLTTLADVPLVWFSSTLPTVTGTIFWLFALALLLPYWLTRYFSIGSAVLAAIASGYYFLERGQKADVMFHVLDVGQAQALVIERQHKAWLIDLGRRFYRGRGHFESVIEPFLKQRGLTVERVSITHSDSDHSGDWRLAQTRLPNAQWFGTMTQQPCQVGQRGRWRGISWKVLWPNRVDVKNSNAASCVYQFSYGAIDWLITGDIGFAEERMMVEEQLVGPVEILVAPHHGSAFSLGSLLLEATQPDVTLVSVGRSNAYGMPDMYTQQRALDFGSEWATTADWGQLSIAIKDRVWRLKTPALFDKTNAKSYSSTSQP